MGKCTGDLKVLEKACELVTKAGMRNQKGTCTDQGVDSLLRCSRIFRMRRQTGDAQTGFRCLRARIPWPWIVDGPRRTTVAVRAI